ncbi:MAG: hypothetical protein K9I34_06655 [Bacteroidales bacterium]|nr:hypothetical protein [Bacteroidales bacterium]
MNHYYEGTAWVYNELNPNPSIFTKINLHIEGVMFLSIPDFPLMHIGTFWYGIEQIDYERVLLAFEPVD